MGAGSSKFRVLAATNRLSNANVNATNLQIGNNYHYYGGTSSPEGVHSSAPLRETQAPHHVESTKPIPPSQHCIQLPKNRNFTGRGKVVEELKEKLFNHDSCQIAALVGLGGIGKTSVALQLAYWVKENKPEYSVIWLPATDSTSFTQACSEIARSFKISQSTKDEPVEESVRHFFSAEKSGKWFLVVDNADDNDVLYGETGIHKHLPESKHGLVLYTTRFEEVAISLNCDIIRLTDMNQPEAAALLTTLVKKPNLLSDGHAVTALLKELVFHPLAMTQAAAYMSRNNVSAAKYIQLLQDAKDDLVGLLSREFQDNNRYPGSKNAVATTWVVSFEQIRRSDTAAIDLLAFLSCIEPKAIPKSIMPSLASGETLIFAIGTLSAYAFLTEREDSEIFDMHNLVHLAAKLWTRQTGLEPQARRDTVTHIAKTLTSIRQTDEFMKVKVFVPHALRIIKDGHGLNTEEGCRILLFTSQFCLYVDRVKEAIAYSERAYHWRDSHLSREDERRLEAEISLATAYRFHGQSIRAIPLMENAITTWTKILPENSGLLEEAHAELAGAYRDNGQFNKAVLLLEDIHKAWEIADSQSSTYHFSMQHKLALAYIDDMRTGEAISLLQKMVNSRKGLWSEDEPRLVGAKTTLARAHLYSGQVKTAIQILEGLVETCERTYDDSHYLFLELQGNLAEALSVFGQHTRAIAVMQKVANIRKDTLAEDHIDRMSSDYQLAAFYAPKPSARSCPAHTGTADPNPNIFAWNTSNTNFYAKSAVSMPLDLGSSSCCSRANETRSADATEHLG